MLGGIHLRPLGETEKLQVKYWTTSYSSCAFSSTNMYKGVSFMAQPIDEYFRA